MLNLRSALLTALLLFSVACATKPSTSPENVALIEQGEKGAVIMAFEPPKGMYAAYLSIASSDADEGWRIFTTSKPAMHAVSPGTYRILGGSLWEVNATANMPLVEFWYKDFTVGGGEIVDLGKLTMETFDVRSMPGRGGQILNVINSLGDRRDQTTYVAYGVTDNDAAAISEMMQGFYPTLAGRIVTRKIETQLDREAFADLVDMAYAPDEDGAAPSTEVARERLAKALAKFMVDGLLLEAGDMTAQTGGSDDDAATEGREISDAATAQ